MKTYKYTDEADNIKKIIKLFKPGRIILGIVYACMIAFDVHPIALILSGIVLNVLWGLSGYAEGLVDGYEERNGAKPD